MFRADPIQMRVYYLGAHISASGLHVLQLSSIGPQDACKVYHRLHLNQGSLRRLTLSAHPTRLESFHSRSQESAHPALLTSMGAWYPTSLNRIQLTGLVFLVAGNGKEDCRASRLTAH